jgi:hypothetical protein
MSAPLTGGCQCGAVRYRFTREPTGAHVCHCRMCQKAFGNFYAPFVGGPKSTFDVTRGEIATFRSSAMTDRGFCARCGTPLTIADVDSDSVSVSIGSLDHPELFPPLDQHGVESRLPYANGIGHLPDKPPTEAADPEKSRRIAATNHQHPDHDTETWPPTGGRPAEG